jgi:5-methylcytosine-specific restriction endonuclease McrA
VDHITPKAEGGTDDHDNLQSICTECHDAKTQAEAQRARGITEGPGFSEDGRPLWRA